MKIEVEDAEGNLVELEVPNKIVLHFKTCEVVDYAVDDLHIETQDAYMLQDIKNAYKDKLEKWISFGELMEVEFDLDSMTARVLS